MKESFRIQGLAGERTLKGEIAVGGAKNHAIKLFAASVLCDTPLTLTNVPTIEDIGGMGDIIQALGGTVTHENDTCTIDTRGLTGGEIDHDIAKRMRASIVFSGPLLARFGATTFPHPGGDVIGERPIDFFIEGFEKMGAVVEKTEREYRVIAKGGLHGADIFFRWVSVTGTETLMMAAVLAKGTTTLRNVAMEPEVVALANFLVASGATIAGIGTPTLVIEGGEMLRPEVPERIIPDRIETGSFIILGALTASDVLITNCAPEHVRMATELLVRAGVDIEVGADTIRVKTNKNSTYSAMSLKTHEYPGFPTDLQAPMMVFLTQAEGESRVFETIFEGRLAYTADLVRMGADITLWNPHQASVKGPTPLRGANLESPDIRAGLAFLIASLISTGESVLENVYHIDRGYTRIEERLQKLGADITRVES